MALLQELVGHELSLQTNIQTLRGSGGHENAEQVEMNRKTS